MPEPVKRGQRYMPGLDGLRAVAVFAVIAYHLDLGWVPGGLLGVGVFFTLSGYLITDLLLAQVAGGGIRLKSFWLARARRLLPALFVMLIIVAAWVTLIGPHQTVDFRAAAASAAGYVNNWWLIFHNVSYFAQFESPQPLNHLWSLSIEEQFYIVWPFLLMIGVALFPGVGAGGVRTPLAGVTLGVALVSAVVMALLFTPGLDPSRAYYGTDTRAVELLFGCALAMVWPSRHLTAQVTPGARRIIDGAGAVGLAVIALMFWQTNPYSSFLYRGGFLVLSVATVMLLAALAHPASRLGPLLGWAPLRWLGERSYGIYLWHFPIIVLTTPTGPHGESALRDVLQVAATIAVAALSWKYLEDPIRHGALGRAIKRLRRPRLVTRPAWAMIGASAAVFAVAMAGLAGVGTKSAANAPGSITVEETHNAQPAADAPVDEDANRASCDSLIHIGDSTSEGLISHDYLPQAKQRITARYAAVGATTQHYAISPARAIYEHYEDEPSAEDIGKRWRERGFDGCWVLALGTNEAANVFAGSPIHEAERIEMMMEIADGDPVLWVNVKTLETSGPYAEENMRAWNEALLAACDRYPNMRIYDWASDVRDDWFIDDGIHFTTPGYEARARLIAAALLQGFSDTGELTPTDSSDCVLDPSGESGPSADAKRAARTAADPRATTTG